MNAQEKWKQAYRNYIAKDHVFSRRDMMYLSCKTMRDTRREAALERQLAAAQHTIESQQKRLYILNDMHREACDKLEAANKHIAELEAEIERMHEEGAAIEEYMRPNQQAADDMYMSFLGGCQ